MVGRVKEGASNMCTGSLPARVSTSLLFPFRQTLYAFKEDMLPGALSVRHLTQHPGARGFHVAAVTLRTGSKNRLKPRCV